MRKEYNKVRTNLFTQVCYSNPFIKENNIDYAVDLNEYDLLIVYRSGETIIFDTFDNTYRIIPYANRRLTDDEELLELSIRLLQRMRRMYIDQEELARRTGVTRSMISRYINRKSIPNYITLCRLAEALDCSLDDLRYTHINIDDERWSKCISY